MRGSSRHGQSRPDRSSMLAGRPTAGRPTAGSRGGRQQTQPAPGTAAALRAGDGRPPAPLAVDVGLVTRLAGPVVAAAGMDLESVRVSAAGRRLLLRVVVDADGGVALDGIADISRDLSAALEAGEVMGEASYTLEVSSPGVDRPLTEPRHWRRAVGRLVDTRLAGGGGAGPGRTGAAHASLRGRVVTATDDEVTLDVEGTRRTFTYADLGPGRVQVEFGRVGQELGGPDGGEPDGH